MDEQIKNLLLRLFFSRNNPKMFNKVIRDTKKTYSPDVLKTMVQEIREKMDSEGLAFVAPAADEESFKLQVKKALAVLENN
ncbi:MAG: hypothetical protein K9I74_14520 [Bacteroidales bacterium]|nr:hypothetical protein [Bacteroidales bacterium]